MKSRHAIRSVQISVKSFLYIVSYPQIITAMISVFGTRSRNSRWTNKIYGWFDISYYRPGTDIKRNVSDFLTANTQKYFYHNKIHLCENHNVKISIDLWHLTYKKKILLRVHFPIQFSFKNLHSSKYLWFYRFSR